VTARVRTGWAPRDSEATYRAIFEGIQDPVLVVEALWNERGEVVDWVCRDANSAMLRVMGLDREGLIGKAPRELLPGRFEALHAGWAGVLATGEPWVYEKSQRGGDQLVRTFRASKDTLVVLSVDVTELRQAERAARLPAGGDEGQLRRRFQSLDHASLALGRTLARVVDVPLEELLQVITDEARLMADAEFAALGIGTDPDLPFAPWVSSGTDPGWRAALGGAPGPVGLLGEVARGERSLRLRDLGAHPAFSGSPPRDPPMTSFLGVPILFRGRALGNLYLTNKRSADEFTEDDQRGIEMLAERAGVLMEVARLHGEVRASVRARDNLLAVVSHDLRSPLAAIRLSAGMLGRRAPGGEPTRVRTQVDRILRATERMNRLIDDLLLAAAIESGAFLVEPERSEVAPIVAELVAAAQPLASLKSIRLEPDVPAGLPPVWCDRAQVFLVLSNLVGNAIKFAPERARVVVGATGGAGEVRLAVCDSGPGIPENQVPHLFDRYWKGKPEGRHGVGLGLYIAKGIVEAHGGRIWVESRPGAGSTFCFTLPVASAGEARD
jgi:PAS domain S-box-containing protein